MDKSKTPASEDVSLSHKRLLIGHPDCLNPHFLQRRGDCLSLLLDGSV